MKELHLILTCDGGNGHKAAASAIESQQKAKGHSTHTTNVTNEGWFSGGGIDLGWSYDKYMYKGGIDMGPFAVGLWNSAQRKSQTEWLKILASLRIFSRFSVPAFRYRTYDLIKKQAEAHPDKKIILQNTQPNCTSALIEAVARYNREVWDFNSKNPPEKHKHTVQFKNHFTDMPTLQAEMFIEELEKIDHKYLDDSKFVVYCRPPILGDEYSSVTRPELEKAYHKRTAELYPKLYHDLKKDIQGNPIYRVKFVDGPIRSEFLAKKETPDLRSDLIKLDFANQDEFKALESLLPNANLTALGANKSAGLKLCEDIDVTSIMLGSQASIDGTKSLIEQEIKLSKAHAGTKPKYVFVFCGKDSPKEGLTLYRDVLHIAKKANNDKLRIIPLTNQSAAMIAHLYSTADTIVTRPGGISIMEIESVAKRAKIVVFTELGKIPKFFNWLLRRGFDFLKNTYSKQGYKERLLDLVAWEAGNSEHVEKSCVDAKGRSRVTFANIYTYEKSLLDFKSKDKINQHLENKEYQSAIKTLEKSPHLLDHYIENIEQEGQEIASILKIKDHLEVHRKHLLALLENYKNLSILEKGPKKVVESIDLYLIELSNKIESNTSSEDLVDFTRQSLISINKDFRVSIAVVKESNFKNKFIILRALTTIYHLFLNQVSKIFGLKFLQPNFLKLQEINTGLFHSLSKPVIKVLYNKSTRQNSHAASEVTNPASEGFHDDWAEFERVLAQVISSDPTKANKSFVISQSVHPTLKHNFIYSGNTSDKQAYIIDKHLGDGSTGSVYLCQSKAGETVVVKFLHNLNNAQAVAKETKCLQLMDCHKATFLMEDGKSVIVQKYIPGRTLHDYVIESIDEKGAIKYQSTTRAEKIQLAVSILRALNEIHQRNIFHGDINPKNILIDDLGTKAAFVDFGNSCSDLHSLSCNWESRESSELYYYSPELLQANAKNKQVKSSEPLKLAFTSSSDIYAVGKIFKDLGLDQVIVAPMMDADPRKRPDVSYCLHTLEDLSAQYAARSVAAI